MALLNAHAVDSEHRRNAIFIKHYHRAGYHRGSFGNRRQRQSHADRHDYSYQRQLHICLHGTHRRQRYHRHCRGSLAIGTDTLPSATPAINYGATTATNTVTVTAAVPPSFAITGAAVSIIPARQPVHFHNDSDPERRLHRHVTLTAAVTSPTGAQDSPTVSFDSTGTVDITSTSAGTATLTISSTGATSSGSTTGKTPDSLVQRCWCKFGLPASLGMPVRRRGRERCSACLHCSRFLPAVSSRATAAAARRAILARQRAVTP